MSETVHYSGKLQRLNLTQEEYQAIFGEPNHQNFVPINGLMYEVINCKQYTGDIFQAKYDLDGTIDFQVQYYNGGCGFSEALEYALNSIGE